MHKYFRSDQFAIGIAGGVWLVGFCLIVQGIAHALKSNTQTPGLAVVMIGPLTEILAVSLLGLVAGFVAEVMRKGLLFLDGFVERHQGESDGQRWDRLVQAVENLTATGLNGLARQDHNANGSRGAAIDSIEQAIGHEEWLEADRLLEVLRTDDPANPEIDRLSRKIAFGRQATIEKHLDEIMMSREVQDSDRVLELFERVAPILDSSARKPLEAELARWFMALIQRRLRSGTIQAEVVDLSARVSELFSGTVEGASLRAGLGTLRRTVGLCPRCGGPYVGTSKACPTCEGIATS